MSYSSSSKCSAATTWARMTSYVCRTISAGLVNYDLRHTSGGSPGPRATTSSDVMKLLLSSLLLTLFLHAPPWAAQTPQATPANKANTPTSHKEEAIARLFAMIDELKSE